MPKEHPVSLSIHRIRYFRNQDIQNHPKTCSNGNRSNTCLIHILLLFAFDQNDNNPSSGRESVAMFVLFPPEFHSGSGTLHGEKALVIRSNNIRRWDNWVYQE